MANTNMIPDTSSFLLTLNLIIESCSCPYKPSQIISLKANESDSPRQSNSEQLVFFSRLRPEDADIHPLDAKDIFPDTSHQ